MTKKRRCRAPKNTPQLDDALARAIRAEVQNDLLWAACTCAIQNLREIATYDPNTARVPDGSSHLAECQQIARYALERIKDVDHPKSRVEEALSDPDTRLYYEHERAEEATTRVKKLEAERVVWRTTAQTVRFRLDEARNAINSYWSLFVHKKREAP